MNKDRPVVGGVKTKQTKINISTRDQQLNKAPFIMKGPVGWSGGIK